MPEGELIILFSYEVFRAVVSGSSFDGVWG